MTEHFLIVEHVDPLDPDTIEWYIEHPDDCPKIERWEGVLDNDCAFSWEVDNAGRDSIVPFPKQQGRYHITHWHEKIHIPLVGVEHNTGIAVHKAML